jgi:hypothetical protein
MFILQVLTTIYLENELESFTMDENIITTTSYPIFVAHRLDMIIGATNRMILAKMQVHDPSQHRKDRIR